MTNEFDKLDNQNETHRLAFVTSEESMISTINVSFICENTAPVERSDKEIMHDRIVIKIQVLVGLALDHKRQERLCNAFKQSIMAYYHKGQYNAYLISARSLASLL